MAYRSKHLEESQTSPRRLDSGGLRRASRLTLLNPSHDLADRRGAAASLFSGRLPGMTQSVVLPYPSLHLRIDRKRSGSRASGAVRGSRLINPRSNSRRGIEGITRVRIGKVKRLARRSLPESKRRGEVWLPSKGLLHQSTLEDEHHFPASPCHRTPFD